MSAANENAEQPVIVLLAAGASRRYGAIKQLASIEGESMLRRVADTLLALGAPVVVVTGAHASEVETAIEELSIIIERHARWDEGMGSSLAAGVSRARANFPDTCGVLICLADQPLLDRTLLNRMLARHQAARDAILTTTHAGVDGPPVLFPRDCFDALAIWSGERGARALLEREAHRVERFDSSRMVDVDTPIDLERVREQLTARATPGSTHGNSGRTGRDS